ncbi:DNA mismatch repair protein msh6 [Coelomomyces lativittatus]|nr:DNA mismatch repair protein msh6 [Coelomomyces lativittatus]
MNPQQSTLHHYFQFTSNATTTPKKSINKNESKPNLNTPDITNLSITSQHAITTPPPPSASLKFTAKSTNLMDSKTIEKNQLHSSSNYKSDSTFASSSASISSSSRNTFTSKDPKSLLSLIPSIVSSSFSSASHPNSTPTIFTGLDHASIANAPKKYNVSQTSLPSNDMQIDEADYDSYKVPIKRTRSSLSNKRRNYIGSDSNDSSAESDSELISPKKKHGIQLETEMKLGPETKNENGSLTVPIPLGLISPIKQPFFNNGKKKTSSSFKNMIASKSDAFEISALTTATSLSSDSSICAIKLVSESSLPTTSFPIWLSHPKDQQGHPSNHPNYDPSSLFIPKKVYDQMTDFEKQYWDVKANYFDCVVFFQKGKFYELYEIDAELAQREFDLKMSGGTGGRNAMKMAGVPESSLEEWVAKFVGRGYKVVQVDQREKTKDGLLRRDIAMVHSSGTVNLHPWAAYTCVYVAPFLLLIETGVATLHWCHCPLSSQLETLLTRAKPNELVLDSLSLTPSMKRWFTAILPATTFTVFPFQWTMEETKKNCFKNSSTLTKNENYMDTESVLMKIFGEFYENEALWKCIAGCFMFLDKMKLSVLFRLEDMKPYSKIELNGISHLQLDSNTLTHLQLLDVDHPHSLLSILNHCLNPMGQRLLRQWICFPLTSIPQLLDRQSALNELRMHPDLTALKEQLRMLPDLARLLGRIQLRLAKPKDFLSFIQGFISFSEYLPSLNFHSNILVSLIHHYPDIQFILSTIQQSFIFNSTQHILPQSGVHDLYDQLNEDIQQIENELHEYMLKLKLSMKLNNLTYVHMGKDNYQLEVPSSMKVPKDWMRVSATKKVIRYHTPTIQTLLKTMELKQTLRTNILRTIINDVFDIFSKHIHTFQSACECIAQLDVYQSFVYDQGFQFLMKKKKTKKKKKKRTFFFFGL